MNRIIDKFINRLGLVRRGALPQILESILAGSSIGEPQPQNYAEYLKTYTNEEWVYICVTKIAKTIKGLPIKLFKPSVKNDVTQYDEIIRHPFLDLLKKPNPKESQSDLIDSIVANRLLTGNAYCLLDGKPTGSETGIPKELYSLNSSRIRKTGTGFIYAVFGRNPVTYKNGDIEHYKTFNSISDYYGLSAISAGKNKIEASKSANEFNRKFFENGASVDGVIEVDGTLTDTAWQRLMLSWKQKYSGKNNAHRTAILEEGAKYKEIMLNQRDMEFINTLKINRETICALFGVPPAVVGIFEYANYANSDAQIKMYYNDTIIPELQQLRNFLQRILDRFDSNLWVDFDLSGIEALRENEKMKSEIAEAYFKMGVPFNQIIEKLNLPFDPILGGDVGYLPFTLMPVGKSPAAPPPKPPQEQPPEEEKTIKFKSFTKEQKRKKWEFMIKMTEEFEKKMRIDLNKYYSKLEQEMIDNLNKLKNLNIENYAPGINYIYETHSNEKNETIKKQIDIDSVLFDEDAAVVAYIRVSNPYRLVTVEESGKNVFEMLALSDAFNMSSERVVEYLQDEGLKKAVLITGTARDAVKTSILEGLKEKETIQELTKRIKETMLQYTSKEIEGYAAERIARTELHDAANFGSTEAYKQADIEYHSWVTTFDAVTRDSHARMDGEVVKVGERFSNGLLRPGDPGGAPEEIINCRCDTAPVVKGE